MAAEPDFDDLVNDILLNPEKVFDEELTDEDILALQKRLNPYSYVPATTDSERKRAVAVSYTNLRAEYLERFTMTSLVGFVFRMLDEWEVPAERRRWVSKAAAKRARQKGALQNDETEPFTPEQLVERSEALHELAKLVKEAAGEAAAATAAAKAADADFGLAAFAAPAEKSLEKKRVDGLFKEADAALARARGLQYTVMYETRKFGLESDRRIDRMAEVARQHPEVREIIDRDPIKRPTPGQQEIPAGPAKAIISDFLRAWFEYNPDAHVRSAHDEFVIARAAGTAEVPGLGPVRVDEADPSRLPLEVVRAARSPVAEGDAEAFAALTANAEAYNTAVHALRDESVGAALAQALAAPERFTRYLFPVAAGSPARPAVDVVPPQDTFHRWKYYMEVNMEALRTATEAIYHEKPDLDWALLVYDFFEGTPAEVDAAFEVFRDKHQDEVISDIKGIDLNAWTLLADFGENRKKINFYNKHVDVLKRILDRHAEDKKLGQDLMRNRIRGLKAQNIREDGPDAPGLAEYRGQNANKGLNTMGAERVISREEMARLERAQGNVRAAKELEVLDQCTQTITDLSAAAKVRDLTTEEERQLKDAQVDIVHAREMIEVPPDAIQVDVWTHDAGSGKFGKSKFFTKAEAPTPPRKNGKEEVLSGADAPPLASFAQELLNAQLAAEEKAADARLESNP